MKCINRYAGCLGDWIVALGALLAALPAAGACLVPPGDVTGDGAMTVVDVQCNVIVNLWTLSGGSGSAPSCVGQPGSPVLVADQNCDGIVNVSDTLIMVSLALQLPLSLALDSNGDSCVDACGSDLDGDGDFDVQDCAPLDATMYAGAPEVCNGADDDCDGQIDEPSAATVHQSCNPADACLAGFQCQSPGAWEGALVITEVMAEGSAGTLGAYVELFNPSAIAVNAAGFSLGGDGMVLHKLVPGGGLFVPARGYVVLAESRDPSANGGLWAPYQWSTPDLLTGIDVLELRDAGGVVVDEVPIGALGFPAAPGVSAALMDPSGSNGAVAAWAGSVSVFGAGPGGGAGAGHAGTPGGANLDVMTAWCDAGGPVSCDDGNPCTDDDCDATSGCTSSFNGAACEDGDLCTQGDVCSAGACASGPMMACEDANPCTADSCLDGACVFEPTPGSCDDSDACTVVDVCSAGICTGTQLDPCDDGNPCTTDGCDPATGCTHVANTATCDDGNACTTDDQCAGQVCVGGAQPDCDDGNPCTNDGCDASVGCTHAANSSPCDDGNACTANDTCSGGGCVGGATPNCDDGNICTTDSCNPASGCVSVPNAVPCNDGNVCTTTDQCSNGTCVGSGSLTCNDGNACTNDSCLPSSGCVHLPNSNGCNDGNLCTLSDVCQNGSCVGTGSANCNDGNACTDDGCNPSTGCVSTPNAAGCNDGNACTPNDVCQNGSCVGLGSINCNDGNPCTNDSCHAGSGCQHANNSNGCNDGNACTPTDQCSNGSCIGSGSVNCNDGNPCTNDFCNPGSGCGHANNSVGCNDGNACTPNDQCSNGSCVGFGSTSCDDGNPCTTDSCSPAQGCVFNNTYCSSTVQIYRHWWMGNDHMDSHSPSEGGSAYIHEGPHYRLFSTQGPGFVALHRKYWAGGSDHMTTNSSGEGSGTYVYEALLGYCLPQPTPQANKALWRMYHSAATDHITTWATADINKALVGGYVKEAILCYVQ